MKYIITFVLLVVIIIAVSFIPMWNVRVKSGYTKVNFWEKQQISSGELVLD